MNSSAASLALGVLVVLVSMTTATSIPVRRQARQDKGTASGVCSKNMACQWAVCPWSRDYMFLIPNPTFCLIIPNHCECATGSKCTLTNNTKPGATLVRHEYRCVSQDKWNPQQVQLID